MKTNESTNACPKCGAPVPAEAPQGLCPKCVFVQAVAPEAAPTATANIPSLERLAVAFPQLQIIELIGRGGMGFVFKARQPHLDRFVALKLLPDSLAHDPHFAERFNREGRTLARLNHPSIVSIFDFGQAGGFYFLLMEYVDGVNLRQAMQAGRFSPTEALAIVPKICEALQYAHEEGVLHRDIKPENILLDAKGRVKIADFGIAKIVGDEKPDVSLTATGAALGTPHYMAPEQFEKPGTVDHRADIYSLGVVFYEMLTGELPIGRFSPPSQRTPLDPRVDDVVMRTLEKEREKRFQSAGEMKTNVEHLTEAGAGGFKGVPPRAGDAQVVAHGTMVINPSAVIPAVPQWSLKAVWGAVLVGISFLPVALLVFVAYYAASRRGGIGGWEIGIASLTLFLPAIAGTILGWMGLSDIRAHQGKLRGLPLATFAALTWPLLILLGVTLIVPLFISHRAADPGHVPMAARLMLLVPAGAITFAIWAVYAAVRWGGNTPSSKRRGVLKWVFLALLLFGVAATFLPRPARPTAGFQPQPVLHTEPATPVTPWIRFTFTAVELREAKGVRWLAIDYLDEVHGECDKSFPWEATIPGHRPETRTSAALLGDTNAPVRHQRVEYRMPDSMERDVLEKFRDEVAKKLNYKSFRLEPGEEKELFELVTPEGGSLKARIKAMPPIKTAPEPRQTAWQQAQASVERVRRQNEEAAKKRAQAKSALPNETDAYTHALQFRLVADDRNTNTPVDVMTEFRSNGTSNSLRVLRTVLLDGSAVARAAALETNGHCTVEIELTEEGARQFAAITGANVNRRLAIVSGDRVLSAPVIRTPISGGKLQISGDMPSAEARQLVASLNRTTMDSLSASDARMVIDVARIEPLSPELAAQVAAEVGPRTNSMDWRFIGLIPPDHLAEILFVRWTNGIPTIAEGRFSAYHKVGKTPAEIELFISHDLNGPPIPENRRSQWTVSPGMDYSASTYAPPDPPYRRIETPARMSVRPGHQRRIPLVEFGEVAGGAGRRSDGVDLHIILQPLTTPAIRTVPTEKDKGHYVSGHGLVGTREEALNAIRSLPIDP